MYPIIGLLILVLDIYTIYLIMTSSAEAGMKLVWVIVVLPASADWADSLSGDGPQCAFGIVLIGLLAYASLWAQSFMAIRPPEERPLNADRLNHKGQE